MKELTYNALNEFEKLTAKPGIKLFFYAAAFLPFLIAFVAAKVQTNDMISLSSLNISFSILNIFVMIILPLFSITAAAEQFSGEWERGTLFPVRPISRVELFFSKYAAIGLLLFIQLGIVWISAIVSTWVFEKKLEWGTIGLTFTSALVSIVPVLALTAFVVFTAQWFKNSSAVITVNILIIITMMFLPFIYPNVMYFFPTSYLDWYTLWQEDVNILRITQSLTYLFSFSSLFLAAGYYMFNRKEL